MRRYSTEILTGAFIGTLLYLTLFCQFPAPSIKGEPFMIKTEMK